MGLMTLKCATTLKNLLARSKEQTYLQSALEIQKTKAALR
jgi:hypothetical protein